MLYFLPKVACKEARAAKPLPHAQTRKLSEEHNYYGFSDLYTLCQHLLWLFKLASCIGSGRRDGLVVSALDSRARGPGSSPGRVIVLCSWARHFTLTMLSPPRSINGYRRNAGGLPAMD